jgi:hypothetical protein
MANIINGTDTGSGGLITTGDSSDELQIQTAETTAITITSGQQSVFIAGTAAAPAVTTTGDLNTGIFFSAADTLVVTTGGTAAVTVDSGQRTKFPTTIGVGGATPSTSGAGFYIPFLQHNPHPQTQTRWMIMRRELLPITVPNNGGTVCFIFVDASTVANTTEIYVNINYAV